MALALGLAGGAGTATATEPPQDRDGPVVGREREGYVTRRGLKNLTATVARNRLNVRAGRVNFFVAEAAGGLQIRGTRFVPVLPVIYRNTAAEPYAVANLQRQLFDGPWPSGTMSDYYREVSYGAFGVTGTVLPWRTLARDDTFYEGADTSDGPCNGTCGADKVGDLLQEAFSLNDASVDYAQFDNDGPDNRPNSGDDDGYVDFIAIVQPEVGGECTPDSGVNRNIWSHRFSYRDITGADYETADVGAGGAKIRIDDYVIVPALACDGATMIQIGVFAHEFGHAFGLPDLYDTDSQNGLSAGIGTWGLMGAGSWGGDNDSPHSPSHMSAWEKEFLGWVRPTSVGADVATARLHPIEQHPEAFKIALNNDEYYLIEYRRKIGFDRSLPGSGLLVWKVNQRVVTEGLRNNKVNGDATNKGVALIEADGLDELDRRLSRGDFGDMFRGRDHRLLFDASGHPASARGALCGIGEAGDVQTLQMLLSKTRCE
ncbi:MAG TPA: M6 family metalloprotease domain-containing protein [Allosphingosinicella sp.]